MTPWAVLLEIVRQLRRGRGLAGAVDADDQDRLRPVGQRADRRARRRRQQRDWIAARVTSTTSSAVGRSAPGLQRRQDLLGQRHAEVGADQRFLQFIPIDRPAGELLEEGFEKADSHLVRSFKPMRVAKLKREIPLNIRRAVLKAPGGHCRRRWERRHPPAAVRSGRVRSSLTRSRMPLTKRLLSSVPKRLAISMASLIDTTGGMSWRWSIS